jgi:hypothetical protein
VQRKKKGIGLSKWKNQKVCRGKNEWVLQREEERCWVEQMRELKDFVEGRIRC